MTAFITVTHRRARSAFGMACLIMVASGCSTPPVAHDPAARERAYRANNIGVARLEQAMFPESVAAFREALALDGGLALSQINLAIALLYAQDLDAARQQAEHASRLAREAPQPPFVLGLIARAQNRSEDARAAFERVRQIDPRDVGARVNLAQLALEARRAQDAIELLRPVVADEPFHVTAAYVLGLALVRSGQAAEGQALIERSQTLRQTGYAVAFGTGYLEQGRYAEAIASTGAEPDLVDRGPARAAFRATRLTTTAEQSAPRPRSPFGVRFTADELDDAGARALATGLAGGITLLDADGDADLDLVAVTASGQHLWRNEGSAWRDATAGSGLERMPAGTVPLGVVSADFDNDQHADLFILRWGGSSLLRNDGHGHFVDVTVAAGLPSYPGLPGAAAFADVDHDGDVDLLVAGLADVEATRRRNRGDRTAGRVFPREFEPAPLQLLRNNGNGTFADVTASARLNVSMHAVAIVPTDFDNHRDLDLLIVKSEGAPVLWSNQRDGTFRDVSGAVGLSAIVPDGADVRAVAAGDINKDDWPDLVLATAAGVVSAVSDGRGRFGAAAGPGVPDEATAVQILDYDSDGLLDVLAWTAGGPRVWRNLGRSWQEGTAAALAGPRAAGMGTIFSARAIAIADVDRDDRQDLVTLGPGGVVQWRNGGDARHQTLRVELNGRVSNHMGIGAKVQVRAGSLTARLELSAATPPVAPLDAVVGLGPRPGAEAVRVLWPSGILQAELAQVAATGGPATVSSPFSIEELDRKPSSCPLLFTWNGERFEFATDFLGGGEMGSWLAPGQYNTPDPVEYVRIDERQLQPRDGRFELRVTNELEEALFLDHLQLMVVTHPADVEVYPNEGLTDPPKPARLHAVRDVRPPRRAFDERGRDVTARILHRDWYAPDDFGLGRIRGYADPHALTLDLGDLSGPTVLLLTGWTDYAFSSDNVAAHQAGLSSVPPALDVRTPSGSWRPVRVPIGIPVGRPQTIPVDLSGHLRAGETQVRLNTNMRVYWDQVRVATSTPQALTRRTLPLLAAGLRVRGFSAERRPHGRAPVTYDYERVRTDFPWKAMSGWFTREGDVRPLLDASDDRFAIARSGDEIALQFSAVGLPPASPAWNRTFLLRADGFSKEMDVNSASPFTVEPLPFHGMSRYPYPVGEHYPDTPDHARYRAVFNTRRVVRPLPPFPAVPGPIGSRSRSDARETR